MARHTTPEQVAGIFSQCHGGWPCSPVRGPAIVEQTRRSYAGRVEIEKI